MTDGIFESYKDLGLVNDVFTPEQTRPSLGEGNIARRTRPLRHDGLERPQQRTAHRSQPHQGQDGCSRTTETSQTHTSCEKHLSLKGSIFHTTSDTEVISYIITKERLTAPSIEDGCERRAMERIKGAYSLVIMSPYKAYRGARC